ncbi:LysR family transcriptional regulator substrate-binding protein [Streptomyces monashensis]|uniref:LysR family transcriptional regulator substrate-binding protein n=1 Tax=Streptomyces monashensis TaxID=1678012 RepID=UPI0009A0A8A6|nr:LysR family transcriptional regulator substrate-binding protein [Streptomyces monashensis]
MEHIGAAQQLQCPKERGHGHQDGRDADHQRAPAGPSAGSRLDHPGRRPALLDELEQARHELARLTGLTGGSLLLGTLPTAGVHLLPPPLSAFRRAHPDVTLSVADYDPPTGVTAVAAGEVDLALTHAHHPAEPTPVPSSVRPEPVLTGELVLVTAPGHALSGVTSLLPPAEPAGQPLISVAPRHPARREIEALPARSGATPALLVPTPGYTVVCAPASAGLGVAVVPKMVARTAATPVGMRLMEAGRLHRTTSVAYRPDEPAPAADAFRALLRGAFGRPGR